MYPNMRGDHNMPSIILKKQNLFVTHLSHTVYKVYQKIQGAIWPIVSYTFVAKEEISFQLFDISLVWQNCDKWNVFWRQSTLPISFVEMVGMFDV